MSVEVAPSLKSQAYVSLFFARSLEAAAEKFTLSGLGPVDWSAVILAHVEVT